MLNKKNVPIKKFNEYNDSHGIKHSENNDVIEYLYSLDDPNLVELVNDLITSHNPTDIINDILLEIGDSDSISDEKYHWVEDELKKYKK
jgi:hypothetical protein